jgi:Regulator of chromosome condensation (RCC1) repeat
MGEPSHNFFCLHILLPCSIGDSADEKLPNFTVNVGEGRSVKAVAAAGFHTCAILDNDSLVCWGKAGTATHKDFAVAIDTACLLW